MCEMRRSKFLWVLVFLIFIFGLVLVLVLPTDKYQALYAEESYPLDERLQIVTLINQVRKDNGVQSLTFSETLSQVATFRACDMFNRNYFSHYTPEGTNVFNLMRNWKIRFKYGGENLAKGKPANYVTPEKVVNAWKRSHLHKCNLLKKGYNRIGVGIEVRGGEKIVVVIFISNPDIYKLKPKSKLNKYHLWRQEIFFTIKP